MRYHIYLGIGANLGDRKATLKNAARLIQQLEPLSSLHISSLWETSPVGCSHQPSFLNAVLRLSTSSPPEFVHQECRKIEERLGKKTLFRNGPRVLDIDLLYIENSQDRTALFLASEQLLVPHPRMWERLFVLLPLAELLTSTKSGPVLWKGTKKVSVYDRIAHLQTSTLQTAHIFSDPNIPWWELG